MKSQETTINPATDLIHADTGGENLHAAYPNIFETTSQAVWFTRTRADSGWGSCFTKVGKRPMLNRIAFARKFEEEAGAIVI